MFGFVYAERNNLKHSNREYDVCRMRWAFIIAFPTPEVLVKADKRKWENFLHGHKLARPATYLRRLEVFARAHRFAGSAAAIRAKSKLAVARARQFQLLES